MFKQIAQTHCLGNKTKQYLSIDFIANLILPGTCPKNKTQSLPGFLILDPAPIKHLDKTIWTLDQCNG